MNRYWAKLNNNRIVTDILIAKEEDIISGAFGLPQNFVETSKKGEFRVRYASVGDTYDMMRNAFISPKPYDSWTFNEKYCQWEAPVAFPQDGKWYEWDEEAQNWVA